MIKVLFTVCSTWIDNLEQTLCIIEKVGVKYHGPLSIDSAKYYCNGLSFRQINGHWLEKSLLSPAMISLTWIVGLSTICWMLLVKESLLVFNDVPIPSELYVKSLLVILLNDDLDKSFLHMLGVVRLCFRCVLIALVRVVLWHPLLPTF